MIFFQIHEKSSFQAEFPFVQNDTILNGKNIPKACLSLKKAGSMRFRWTEHNDNRDSFFSKQSIDQKKIVPVELIHSKNVFAVAKQSDTFNLCGDGILTQNQNLIPSVTVADCMPIYLFDETKNVFGVVHSGWKGTGIIEQALDQAKTTYNCRIEDFSIIFGPHIRSCCYKIDEERKIFFQTQFSKESVVEKIVNKKTEVYVSLQDANLYVLEKMGIKLENISICTDCTCCSLFLGSFRRETSHLPLEASIEERWKNFTPMLAYIGY
ncbi:MAG: polyphenol oxidase family protein [Treponemataceae bacterium]